MRGGPAQCEHGGGLRAAKDLAVAPAGLEDPERQDGRAWHLVVGVFNEA